MSTRIEWCDETFNPWWGCERVSPGCARCYADTWARRMGMDDLWDNDPNAEHRFRFFGDKHWAEPLKWARTLPAKLGRRPRVFCASMADVFEPRLELGQPRERLFALIAATPELDWLILTKRPDYARLVLRHPQFWLGVNGELMQQARPVIPGGMSDLAAGRDWLPNVWMGTSIENARFTWRADVLREIPAAVRFISAEPLLGSLFKAPSASARDDERAARRLAGAASDSEGLARTDGPAPRGVDTLVTETVDEPHDHAGDGTFLSPHCRQPLDLTGIDWTIIGGESGRGSRRMDPAWAVELVVAAERAGSAPFVKQLGSVLGKTFGCADSKGGDIDRFPAVLKRREFPERQAVAP